MVDKLRVPNNIRVKTIALTGSSVGVGVGFFLIFYHGCFRTSHFMWDAHLIRVISALFCPSFVVTCVPFFFGMYYNLDGNFLKPKNIL